MPGTTWAPNQAQDGTELCVDAEVVVVGGAHADESAGLALKALNGDVVEEVLEGAGEGGAENRGGDQVHIGGYDALDDGLGVVIVIGERASIGEGDAVVAEVQNVGGRRFGAIYTGQGGLDGMVKAARTGDGAVDGEEGGGHSQGASGEHRCRGTLEGSAVADGLWTGSGVGGMATVPRRQRRGARRCSGSRAWAGRGCREGCRTRTRCGRGRVP